MINLKDNKPNKTTKKGGKGQKHLKQLQLQNVTIFGSSKMGYGPKKTESQDSYCILEKLSDDIHYLAVYDGHGSSGKEASQAANDYIQTYLEKNIRKLQMSQTDKLRETFLRDAFKQASTKLKISGIDYSNSGTCAISVLLMKNILYCCNLGDSRAVLYRVTNKEKLAIEVSYDQKPTRPDEKLRIIKMGGKIEKLVHDGAPVGPYRVWLDDEGPGIAMTRSLGDLTAKKIGLISEPEIQHLLLEKGDRFVVMGSDGVWDVMSSAEVCGFVDNYEMGMENCAEALVNECRVRWDEMNRLKKTNSRIGDLPYLKFGCDDITCVIAYLSFSD